MKLAPSFMKIKFCSCLAILYQVFVLIFFVKCLSVFLFYRQLEREKKMAEPNPSLTQSTPALN